MTPQQSGFEKLLAAAQAGDELALATLYRGLNPALLRYLAAEEPVEGEDLASEVWLAVARGIGRFEGDESAFRALLFTIARRRVLDLRRSRSRRRTDPVEPGRLAASPDVAEPAFARHGAVSLLAALPPEQAEIVLLRVVAGLDSNEVALVTGKKPGTVRVIQKRALEHLAELLQHESEDVVTQ